MSVTVKFFFYFIFKMRKILSRISVLVVMVSLAFVMTSSNRQFTIFMIGDSTMANKDIKKGQERGWGMVLQGFFTENVLVDNHALNGRSSRSFIIEGHWQKVYDAMKPGDYLVIQFGHNDEKGRIEKGNKRHTEPGLTFDDNYRMFIRAAQEKGVTPIVMNAVVRRNFYKKPDLTVDDESLRGAQSTGKELVNSDTLIDTHGLYIVTPQNVAKLMRVPYVDANKITKDLENGLGVEASRKLHMISAVKNGKDNTHYTVYGAHEVASRLVDAMADVCPELKPYVRHYDYIVSAKGKGNYLTLQDAVDAAPKGKLTQIYVIDGEYPNPKTNGKKIKIIKYSTVKIK